MSNPSGRRAGGEGAATQVQSVDRALAILDFLAAQGSAGVTEIAGELDVHKSTAFRLVTALENHQLVEQVEERGKYRLGFGIVRLAGATAARLDLSRESLPVCVHLARELGETVNVAVLDVDAAMNVTQEHGNAAIAARNWIGQRTPLHATSSGKVLLAGASEGRLKELLAERLPRFTEQTITTKRTLRSELKLIRGRGWAESSEELELGLNAVAAPIFGADGKTAGAVSVSGPSYRIRPELFGELAEKLRFGGQEISSRIGYFGSY